MADPVPPSEVERRRTFEAAAPATLIETDPSQPRPAEGIGLCLSGGGYRAMLFHLGALWRLNETGVMRNLTRVSSVSGGSITAGLLGVRWNELEWEGDVAQNFGPLVVGPVRRLASKTIDVKSILVGLLPRTTSGNRIAAAYRSALFGGATLQDLPDDSIVGADGRRPPRFVINATNLQSGVLWRFSRPYMADYTVGLVPRSDTPLATAVAASAAFPPLLSPVVLKVDPAKYAPDSGARPVNADHRVRIVLTDGGVYDNMGLETVWKKLRTVLVSDAGGGSDDFAEKAGRNWLRQFWQVFWIQRSQVGRVRRRQLIASYQLPEGDLLHRRGTYWGIGTDIANYGLGDALPAPVEATTRLRDVPTRLKAMPPLLQERLINWGYAVSDAALRRHYDAAIPRPAQLPYPASGIG
jgi:NTE family protein